MAPGAQHRQATPRSSRPCTARAPDIAGKGIANPLALMLSAAMMLDHVGHHDQATRVRNAPSTTTLVEDKVRTGDLGGKATTREFAAAVCARVAIG